jgi:hypothetical protein
MTVTLNLTPETERWLRAQAAQSGQTLEAYVQQLVARDTPAVNGDTGTRAADPASLAEFDRWLNELSDGLPSLPTLPADWLRRDV